MTAVVDLRLYVIVDPAVLGPMPVAQAATAAIEGGATVLQVRAKKATTRELLDLTTAVIAAAKPHGVPTIVNDRVDIAMACGADGVHLGDDDLPVSAARAIMGDLAIIGCSASSVEAARLGAQAGADYLGTGDVFGTTTKPDAHTPIGIEGLAAVVAAVPLPVVAIGGIAAGRARLAIDAGAAGVAAISAVLGADDIARATRSLRSEVDEALAERASAA